MTKKQLREVIKRLDHECEIADNSIKELLLINDALVKEVKKQAVLMQKIKDVAVSEGIRDSG